MQPQMQQLPPSNGMMSALQRPTGYPNIQPQQQQQPIPYSAPLQQQQPFQLSSPPPLMNNNQSNLINQNAFNGPPTFSSQPKISPVQQQQDNLSQGPSISSNIRPPISQSANFQPQPPNFQSQPPNFQSQQQFFQQPQFVPTSYQPPLVNNPSNLEDKISNLTLSGPPSIQQQQVMPPPTQTKNLIPSIPQMQNRNESPLSFNSNLTAINQQPPQSNQFSMNGRLPLQRPPGPPSSMNSQATSIPPTGPPMLSNSFNPNQQHQSLPPTSQQNQFQQPPNQFQPINQFVPQLPQMSRPGMMPPQTQMPPQPGMFNNQPPYTNQPGMIQQAPTPLSQFDQYNQQLPQPPSYQQQQQQAPNRIDMDSIPNPIEVMQVNNSKYGGEIFETNEAGKLSNKKLFNLKGKLSSFLFR